MPKPTCPYCHIGEVYQRYCDVCGTSFPRDWAEAYVKMHGGISLERNGKATPTLSQILAQIAREKAK